MLHLRNPSRRHAQHATFGTPKQQPQVSHSDAAARQLEQAKRLAIAALRRRHEPSKLSQVQGVEDDGTDEAPTSSMSSSTCPSPLINPGKGRSLFERMSYKKADTQNRDDGGRSLEDRVNWAPPIGNAAHRGSARERGGGQGNEPAAREARPFVFGRQNVQVDEGGMAWTPENRAPSLDASTGLYQDFPSVAAKPAKIPSPLRSPWKAAANNSKGEDYAPPPVKSPPMATWSTWNQKEEASAFAPTIAPPPLDFGNNFDKRDMSSSINHCTPTFQSPRSTMWATHEAKQFTKLPQAPRPPKTVSFSSSTNQPPSTQPPAPRSVPACTMTTSISQAPKTQSTYTRQPHDMPQLQHLHIAPMAALSFNPPLTPLISSYSSRPQLSTSVYLACLGAQIEVDTQVMLKCRMGMCAHREGVTFRKESLRNGVVEKYRQGFGCGGCGEMMDVVVC